LQGCTNILVNDVTPTVQIQTLQESTPGIQITIDYYGLVMYTTEIASNSGFQIQIYYSTLLIASSSIQSCSITNSISKNILTFLIKVKF